MMANFGLHFKEFNLTILNHIHIWQWSMDLKKIVLNVLEIAAESLPDE